MRRGFESRGTRRLVFLLCIGSAVSATLWLGDLNVKAHIVRGDDTAPLRARSVPSIDSRALTIDHSAPDTDSSTPDIMHKMALREEYKRYLRQALYYSDKDPQDYRQALERLVRFAEEHPSLLDPFSPFGFQLREGYLITLVRETNFVGAIRETHALIESCKRRLEEYDQRGVLNLPLERDILLYMDDITLADQNDPSKTATTESEQRKFVFQQLFRAYCHLVNFYLDEKIPEKNDAKGKETIEDLLSALEAEFGPSFERAPTRGRVSRAEVDRLFIYSYLNRYRNRFESNTSPTYSPEFALKILRPLAEVLPSLESDHGFPPCQRMCTLQGMATLILDLACQSAPVGILTKREDSQHLKEAERVQQRVLDLVDAVDPVKRDRQCDLVCLVGLVSMAKIAWRYGDGKTGDQKLEKASRLADAANDHLIKEVVRRIDKDPSKTAMKDWEPVSGEECARLRGLYSMHDVPEEERTGDHNQQP